MTVSSTEFEVSSHDIISVLQQNRLQWYGHVLQKEDNDWVKIEEMYVV